MTLIYKRGPIDMNSFERTAFVPPPVMTFAVIAHYGKHDKFKVRAFGRSHIMSRDRVITCAKITAARGGEVSLNGFIKPEEMEG